MDENWDDLRYFLAIARAGSLTGAARKLLVSQPTVSRRLSAMERRLSVKLFDRTEDGYRVTEAGRDILGQAETVADQMDEIGRRLIGRDDRLSGEIRITCTEVMANLYLAPHFAAFAEAHPDIQLSIVGTFRNLSLSRREADVALRITSSPSEVLIGRRLVRTAITLYCAADSADPGPDPDWVGWQDDAYNRLLITDHSANARIRHRADDFQTLRAMVRRGMGVSNLPCYIGDVDPGLRRAAAGLQPPDDLELWVLVHPDVRMVARIKLFTDFITEAIRADGDLFEGRRPRSDDPTLTHARS